MPTIPEIKEKLKQLGVKGYSGKNKAELMAMLPKESAKRTRPKVAPEPAKKKRPTIAPEPAAPEPAKKKRPTIAKPVKNPRPKVAEMEWAKQRVREDENFFDRFNVDDYIDFMYSNNGQYSAKEFEKWLRRNNKLN